VPTPIHETAGGDKRQPIDITADSIIPAPRSSPATAYVDDTHADDIPF
jgi:hypothetical protein